jgi:hypothetical protein
MITIVSGLPRSGTSLMMQMLQAGGMPILIDPKNTADPDNPRGYFEWSGEIGENAEGRAVKVLSMRLFELPTGHDYKIIFMRRDLQEVLVSQEVMLTRRGQKPPPITDEDERLIVAHLMEIRDYFRDPHVLHRCDHWELMGSPREVARRVAAFIGKPLNLDAMAAQVDQKLWRNRPSTLLPR